MPTPEGFERWFNELEGYASRAERFYEDLAFDDPQRMKDWLLAAYNQGVRNSLYAIPATPPSVSKSTCSRCGLELSGVMGYVCTNTQCPTFTRATFLGQHTIRG